ncbi:hypothetical protein [Rossellomorea marisflavi]|uniref:hypothetical protein n=1 Tax=Rossellomorea marisflavi TaxID=189381 RepID=UPI00345DADC2
MSVFQIKDDEIAVIDPIVSTGIKCRCGREGMFILIIHGQSIHLCETCLGKVGKTVIDGLI